MDLRQLSYVLAVVDEGSFTRAATALHISQPSLSQAVQAVERELGVQLFHRIGRGVVLSAAGDAFVAPARQALRDLDSVRAAVAAVAGVEAGTLDLVSLPTLAVDPVAALVGRFRQSHPGVTVELAEPETSVDAIERIATGTSEVGIVELPVRREGVVTRRIGEQAYRLIAPPGIRQPMRTVGMAELARLPLVVSRRGTSTRDLLDAAFARVGAAPNLAVETGQREAIVPLVLAGAGMAVVPLPMAEQAGARGAQVFELRPALSRVIGIVHRRGTLSPAAAAFVRLAPPPTERARP